jgi:hypothetical protein
MLLEIRLVISLEDVKVVRGECGGYYLEVSTKWTDNYSVP